ncbi:MAG TPA: tRNA pseudouridine(55) synthase TruB [Solirubrobacterales bacterium]|jgi:tRNA pseudouridine55 synthase|nr:tRNA pseudouridine(55) synthase TruB [Solirubrobacterales bacterium]
MNGGEPTPARGLLVDKPAGITSHDVVKEIRDERGGKVGHAGTLDPFATGLLIVLLGRATRMQRYLLELSKTYRATARLGWRSSTGDPDGELEETGRMPDRLELPTGEVEQQVPMTSAVKVDGERLYRKAHRGESVETPTRSITVHRAELLDSDAERATFEIECSSGTYIRTLVETLDDAYCESLRRTAIGDLEVPAGGPQEISVEELMSFLPERELSEPEAEAVSHGIAVPGNGQAGRMRLTHEGRLIAIARPDGENLQPEVVLV